MPTSAVWSLMGLSTSGIALMTIVNVWLPLVSEPPLAVPPSSDRLTVTVAAPIASTADVYVRLPAALMAGWLEKRPLLLLDTLKVSDWAASSAGPSLSAVAHPFTVWAPEFSLTSSLAPLVNEGESFTAVTVMSNVWLPLVSEPALAVPPSSERLTVTVVVPLALAAGV